MENNARLARLEALFHSREKISIRGYICALNRTYNHLTCFDENLQ